MRKGWLVWRFDDLDIIQKQIKLHWLESGGTKKRRLMEELQTK